MFFRNGEGFDSFLETWRWDLWHQTSAWSCPDPSERSHTRHQTIQGGYGPMGDCHQVSPCLSVFSLLACMRSSTPLHRFSYYIRIVYRVTTSLKKSLKSLNFRQVLEILEKSLNFNGNFGRSLKSPWILKMILEILEFRLRMIYRGIPFRLHII